MLPSPPPPPPAYKDFYSHSCVPDDVDRHRRTRAHRRCIARYSLHRLLAVSASVDLGARRVRVEISDGATAMSDHS
jgi:hypothetical protein